MPPTRRQARIAGLLYLTLGLIAPIGLVYVPGRLFVSGDATATADHLRAMPMLLRIGVASDLLHQVIQIWLCLALYRLFRGVHEDLARQILILGALVVVPVMFMNSVNDLAALILVSGAPFLSVFERPQLDALAYLFVKLHGQGLDVVKIFWGLWLFPFGIVTWRSGFLPRILGVFLVLAGIGWLLGATVSLVFPSHAKSFEPVTMILGLGELPMMFWLLIVGVSEKPVAREHGPSPVTSAGT